MKSNYLRCPVFANMLGKSCVLCLLATITVISGWVQADSARLIGDTYVVASGGEAGKNHGNKPALLVKQGGGDSYVKFALSNASSTVAKATLRVFVNKVTTPGMLAAREEGAGWNESTLTFNNLPAPGAALNSAIEVTPDSKRQWLEFDVTNYVQTQVTAATSEIAFGLAGANNLSLLLDSKETATTSHQPELDIVWASAGPQGPAGTDASVPSGFMILGSTPRPPAGYNATGIAVPANAWTAKAAMPTARFGLAVANVNNKLYAVGGNDGGYSAMNEEYDPASNTWVSKAAMPTARYLLAAATVNGKLYAVGGYNGGPYLDTNEEYDPASDNWSTKKAMPTGRDALAAITVNDKLYALGGFNNTYCRNNEQYDPATNAWTMKPGMPTARYGLAVAAVNNKFYAIGGVIDGGTAVNANEEYDTANNSWVSKTPMPTARYGLATASVNDRVYALGGYDSNYLKTNEEYDPVSNTWSGKTAMPTARYFLAAAPVDNRLFTLGGNNGSDLGTNEEFTSALYVFIKP